MSTDYRALCAELLDALENAIGVIYGEDGTKHISTADAVITKADAALAQPEPEGVTDEEWCVLKMRLWEQYETVGYQGERFMYDADFYTALDVARQEITRHARPTTKPVPGAEVPPMPVPGDAEGLAEVFWGRYAQPEPQGLPPRVGHILRLAEIIREVDGNHGKGAAALAEAILSHPGSRWSPTIEPVPVAERLPGAEDCDACGNCWWFRQATRDDFPFWWFGGGDNASTHWLPHHALPMPGAEDGQP
jgi:hypothetical protein